MDDRYFWLLVGIVASSVLVYLVSALSGTSAGWFGPLMGAIVAAVSLAIKLAHDKRTNGE